MTSTGVADICCHTTGKVTTSIRSDENTFYHDAKHRFRFYQDRIIAEIGDDGARQTAK